MFKGLISQTPSPSASASPPPSASASPPPSASASPPPSASASPPPSASASPPPSASANTKLVFVIHHGFVRSQTHVIVSAKKWGAFATSNKIIPGITFSPTLAIRVELFLETELNSQEEAKRLLEAKNARRKNETERAQKPKEKSASRLKEKGAPRLKEEGPEKHKAYDTIMTIRKWSSDMRTTKYPKGSREQRTLSWTNWRLTQAVLRGRFYWGRIRKSLCLIEKNLPDDIASLKQAIKHLKK
jgi:hypothetical protein